MYPTPRIVTFPQTFILRTVVFPSGVPENAQSVPFNQWPPVNGSSFQGCIRNLYINNELQDFTRTQMKPGVVPGCQPCQELRCVHGLCQPDTTVGPVCRCQSGWGGPHCDQVLLTAAVNPCQKNKWVRFIPNLLFCVYSACNLKQTKIHRGLVVYCWQIPVTFELNMFLFRVTHVSSLTNYWSMETMLYLYHIYYLSLYIQIWFWIYFGKVVLDQCWASYSEIVMNY